MVSNSSITDWEAYDLVITPYEERVNAHEKSCASISKVVRSTQTIPLQTVEAQLRKLTQTIGALNQAHGLRDIDKADHLYIVEQLSGLMLFLKSAHKDHRQPTATEINQILTRGYEVPRIHERLSRYREATMLAMLSRPYGAAFWDHVRKLGLAIEEDLKTQSGNDQAELATIRQALKSVAPDWILRDRSGVQSISRYASRTTSVKRIYPAGLPGHGKRR